MLSRENIPPPIPASRLLDDSEESESEEDDTISTVSTVSTVSTNEIMGYTLEDVDLEKYKRLILAEKHMLANFNKYNIDSEDLFACIKLYHTKRSFLEINDDIKEMRNEINKIKVKFKNIDKINNNIDVIKKDIIKNKSLHSKLIKNPKTIEEINFNINLYKEYSNKEIIPHYRKKIINIKSKKRKEKYDNLLKDFYEYYNKNLIKCKINTCKSMCYNDVGYCLDHYPKVCSSCSHVCDKNNAMDKLITNKFYDIFDLCNECSKIKFKEYYRNNYKKDKIFEDITDEEHLDSILCTMNYEQFIVNTKIYKKLLKIKEKNNMSDSDFKSYLCSDKTLIKVLNISPKTLEENKFFKWQLYRQLSRTSDLVNTFGDKIKYIKFSNIKFRRMGYIQFQAFKDYLFELIYGENYLFNESFYNDLFEDIEEPDTSNSINSCLNCGVSGILPKKELCLNCEYLGIT